MGILADPQHALDLMSGREHTPSRSLGVTTLFLHLTTQDLAADLAGGTGAGTGAVTIERLGAATTVLLTDWLTRFATAGAKVIVRPVLDLHRTWSVDSHDPPAQMREQVLLRERHCVFPGCRRDSRACDLDHIDPYRPTDEGGPPGQTSPENLAPLCRTHHRAKTHTAWTYRRDRDGTLTWTSPTDHTYVVRPLGRRPNRPSSGRPSWRGGVGLKGQLLSL